MLDLFEQLYFMCWYKHFYLLSIHYEKKIEKEKNLCYNRVKYVLIFYVLSKKDKKSVRKNEPKEKYYAKVF